MLTTSSLTSIISTYFNHSGVTMVPVKSYFLNVEYFGAYTWHIMTIDFPKNVGHVHDYENLKEFVYNSLARTTTYTEHWESLLLEACRLWPTAATYLQTLARDKTRWGSSWRLRHFTAGYEASSAVEGSFSAFQ